MKKIIFIILAFVSIDSEAQKKHRAPFEPSALRQDVRLGYLANKFQLTDSVLEILENYRINGYFFALLRDTGARTAPTRIAQYEKEFQKAEDSTKVEKERLGGHCFVESYGDTAAHNKQSGADGPQQFIRSTGRGYNLVGKGFDYRRDPERSFCAAGQYLADMSYMFGSGPSDSVALDFASAGYHMGDPNLRSVIGYSIQQITGAKSPPRVTSGNAWNYIKRHSLTWRRIYFLARPGTALYRKFFRSKIIQPDTVSELKRQRNCWRSLKQIMRNFTRRCAMVFRIPCRKSRLFSSVGTQLIRPGLPSALIPL